MVGGVRIVLGFQADGSAAVNRFAVNNVRSVESNASVELNAGFGRQNGHDASGNRVFQNSGFFRLLGNALVENPVVIVSAGELELFAVSVVIFADFLEFAEVKRGVLYRFDAGRDEVFVNRIVFFSVNLELKRCVEVVLGQVAGAEVEVGVVSQVANSRLVGKGNIVANQLVVVGKRIGNGSAKRSRESLFAVFSGLIEVSTGTSTIAALALPLRLKVSLLTSAAAFGGMSLALQTACCYPALKLGPYLLGKLALGVLSGAACYLLFPLFPSVSAAFASRQTVISRSLSLSALLLSSALSIAFVGVLGLMMSAKNRKMQIVAKE